MNLCYSMLIIAELSAISNSLKCYECKNCKYGIDNICGNIHPFKVCKCKNGELGELKTCENVGQASCVTAYNINGTKVEQSRYCQIIGSCVKDGRSEGKCVSFNEISAF